MKFMNDPAIQQMIHVRGRNVPGLNFYPEKAGTLLYSTLLYFTLHFNSLLFVILPSFLHILSYNSNLHSSCLTGSKHLRNPDTTRSSEEMGGVTNGEGGAGYFAPGPWVVCNDNIVRSIVIDV